VKTTTELEHAGILKCVSKSRTATINVT